MPSDKRVILTLRGTDEDSRLLKHAAGIFGKSVQKYALESLVSAAKEDVRLEPELKEVLSITSEPPTPQPQPESEVSP